MTSDNSDSDDWGLSRRNYVKGLGMAGLAATGGSAVSGSATGAIPDSDIVSVGSGSYTTTVPDTSNLSFSDGGGYGTTPDAQYIYTTSNVSGPIPTNGWWTSAAFGPSRWYDTDGNPHGQGALVSYPDYAGMSARGLTIQNPDDWFGDTSSADFVKMDILNSPKLTVSHTGSSSFADTRIDGWGDWHGRIRWGDGTSTVMDATVVKGSPFTFFEFDGGGAEITFETKDSTNDGVVLADTANIDVWADRGNVLGVTINGITGDNYSHHYALFAPSGSTWSGVGSATLSSDLNGQGYMTVAALPDATAGTLDLFEQYAYNVVRDTYADYDYVQTDANGQPVSEVRTTFDYTTENKAESATSGTLSCLFPHQWKHSSDPVTGHEYWSPRGTLKLHEGGSFQTTLKYPGILPFMPDEGTYDSNQLASYIDSQESDDLWQEGVGTSTNTYFAGKDFDHHLRTVPLSQQVGDTAARDRSLDALRTRIGGWLTIQDTSYGTAEEEEVFHYDSTFGTMIGYNDGFGSAGNMNDHHFHYGYFVRSAAEIARHDDTWVDQYGDMVEVLVRDFANWERPSGTGLSETLPADSVKDAFPRFRNFDVYSGHSWAGGFAMAGDGNNQESSSEAANAYAAMIRWAELTGDTEMRDAAVYLYTHEIHAIWDYWFDPEDDSQPDDWGDNQPDAINGAPSYEYASMVWSSGYDRNIFWGPQDPVEVYGINWLPIGGHSLYLGWDEQYAEANWQDMVQARQRAIDQGMSDHMSNNVSGADQNFLAGWKTCAWAYRAFSDSQDAINLMEAELPMANASHKSAYVYHFVHNINALGSVDTSITADTTMYAVFDDNGSKTYVAYNPYADTRTVTFSDGTTLSVPGNSLKTSNGDVTTGLAPGLGGGGGGDTQDPTAPTNLSGASGGTSSVDLSWSAASDNVGVDHYQVYVDGSPGQTVSGTSATVTGLAADTTYTFTVSAVDAAGNESSQSGAVDVTTDAPTSGQAPYGGSPTALPGTLETEDYDTGGSGVAYSDTTSGNSGGTYRSEDVDIESTSGGGYNVGWTAGGEWLEYTVDVASAGTYDVSARVASNAGGGTLSLSVDGTQQLSASPGGTGGWQTWTTVSLGSVSLSAGEQVVRLTFDTGGLNVDNLAFEAAGDSTAPSAPTGLTTTGTTTSSIGLSWNASSDSGTGVSEYTVYVNGSANQTVSGTSATVSGLSADTSYDLQVSATDGAGNESALSSVLTAATDPTSNQSAFDGPHAVPGTVQAEDFDTGGQGVAYSDTTSGNDGGATYRSTDVDIEGATEGGYNICWNVDGEWLEYTVQVDSTAEYDVSVRVASDLGGGSFDLSVDGTQVGSASFAATGGWQAWSTVDVGTISLSAGEHVVRVDMTATDWNLNWLEFTESSSSGGSGNTVFAVNAGGAEYTAGDGTVYQADTNVSGGNTASVGDSISGTTDDTLYQSERWGGFTYDIPVSNGTYDVELHFAENFFTSDGARVFSVSAEGGQQISGLDVHAEAGHDAALVRTISGVEVSDGSLTITVSASADNPKISAIRVVEASSSSGGTTFSGSSGTGWSATVTNTGTDTYEWAFEPSNTASWADVQFDDGSGFTGYRMDDSDGDNVHTFTRDTSSDGSSIDFRFVYDDGATGQYMSGTRTLTL